MSLFKNTADTLIKCFINSTRRITSMSMYWHRAKKTGPEAGQYFHVRPPIGFIKMGYKTQEE